MSKRKREPEVFTEEIVHAIAEKIALGMTEKQACQATNPPVSHLSLSVIKTKRPLIQETIEIAQARFMEDALRTIRSGVPGWQGSAWILERRHKAQFQKTPTHADEQSGQGALTDDVETMICETVKKITRRKEHSA